MGEMPNEILGELMYPAKNTADPMMNLAQLEQETESLRKQWWDEIEEKKARADSSPYDRSKYLYSYFALARLKLVASFLHRGEAPPASHGIRREWIDLLTDFEKFTAFDRLSSDDIVRYIEQRSDESGVLELARHAAIHKYVDMMQVIGDVDMPNDLAYAFQDLYKQRIDKMQAAAAAYINKWGLPPPSQEPTREEPPGIGRGAEPVGVRLADLLPEGSLVVAEQVKLQSLPGLFRKRIDVPRGETALIVSPQGAAEHLEEGRHKRWGRLLGVGSSRFVIRPRGQFTFLMPFLVAVSGELRGRMLCLALNVSCGIADVRLFYQYYKDIISQQGWLDTVQVCQTLKPYLQAPIMSQAQAYDSQTLLHDTVAQEAIVKRIEPNLRNHLNERGMEVRSRTLSVILITTDMEVVSRQLTILRQQIRAGVRPKQIEYVANLLQEEGLITPLEATQIIEAAGAPTTSLSYSMLPRLLDVVETRLAALA